MSDPARASVAEEDFETTTLPHLNHVAKFALSLTRDRADADDLVQETYLRALRGWRTFRPGTNARRWLFTICRNSFLHLRRRRRAVVETDDGDIDAMQAVMSHVHAIHDGLARVFDHLDVGPAIDRAIRRLPEPHHSILVLVDLEGHSYNEAAAILDVETGTVRSRLHRARRMVQEALIAYAEDVGLRRRLVRARVEQAPHGTDRGAGRAASSGLDLRFSLRRAKTTSRLAAMKSNQGQRAEVISREDFDSR